MINKTDADFRLEYLCRDSCDQGLRPSVSQFKDVSLGAGWSSPVARQAHNLKVVGSNPTPATNNNIYKHTISASRGAFCVMRSKLFLLSLSLYLKFIVCIHPRRANPNFSKFSFICVSMAVRRFHKKNMSFEQNYVSRNPPVLYL